MLQTSTLSASPHRRMALAAITSGTIGILAFILLITYLVLRSASPVTGTLMIRFHDAGVMLQFLLMIPVALGLYTILQQQPKSMSRVNLYLCIAALLFTILFLLLGSLKVVADTLYMFPQGIFGVWLIIVNRLMKGILDRKSTRLNSSHIQKSRMPSSA